MIKNRLTNILGILLIAVLALSACGGSAPEATPTLDPILIQTQAVETFSAALTQTALASPSDTPLPTLTLPPAPTFPSLATSTTGSVVPTQPLATSGTIANSCYGLVFVSDVTIPDNTTIAPGQTFTKTWKVKNSGTCAWDAGFKFAFTGGNAMNGAIYTLPSSVAAGVVADISIAMTAPTTAGKVQGNWRMTTAGGQFFGNEVYVIIVVGGSTVTATVTTGAATNASVPATATTASTSTTAPTATATATSTTTTP